MPRAVIVIIVLLGAWVLVGGPVPGVAVKPLEPNPELPTFSDVSLKDNRALKEAIDMGRVRENPERRKLRQAYLDAEERMNRDACDDERRRAYALAAAPFLENAQGKRKLPVETVEIDGKPRNASKEIESDIMMRIHFAFFNGQIRPSDLPPDLAKMGRVVARARSTGAKSGTAKCSG